MTARDAPRRLRIGFDAQLPTARWGPLFHVFLLEHPDLRLEWQPTGFPIRGRSLLEGADAGVFVEPPPESGRSVFTLDVSPMVVIVAAGHPSPTTTPSCAWPTSSTGRSPVTRA